MTSPRAINDFDREICMSMDGSHVSWRRPQRTFKGTCALCETAVDKRRSAAHHSGCAPAHDPDTGRRTDLVSLRITAVGAAEYWLDVEAATDAALSKLDSFLRNIWLECCGHLSMFSVPPFRYSSSPSGMSGLLGRANTDHGMRAKIGEAFNRAGQKGTYDYDFGSTTRLAIERTGARVGLIGRESVRLLVRNDPLAWTCGSCGKPATLVCCAHETESSPVVCAAHKKAHRCSGAMFLPVVNSPRMGVCGYAG